MYEIWSDKKSCLKEGEWRKVLVERKRNFTLEMLKNSYNR